MKDSVNNNQKYWWRNLKNKINLWFCRLCWHFIKNSEDKLPETTTSLPDLCPTSYAEGNEAYEERLTDLLLNHHKVTEIALTSPYSGGKSSLIDTYMRKHPYHKYTNISLADFKIETEGKDQLLQPIQIIEKSIVQQILYRVKDSEMPNSRFRKIVMREPSLQWVLVQPLGLLILIISIAIVIFPTSNITTSLNTLFGVLDPKLAAYAFQFGLLFIFTFPFLLLKDLFKYLNKFSISKLNLLKGEVTLDTKNNDSIFNLHIEEIVYYFSATRSDIVIFEDLDRFDKPEIFIKLKEINKLINDSKEVNQRVCFIYALKDDVFNGSNRTKFFDAIIPIIPITNSVNSYPRLKKLLEDSDLISGLNDEFLRDVAVFIEDMRMLKNIVTEYSIYKQTLKSSIKKPEYHRLFSFIVYKNIYCADFADLQANSGVLVDFFKNKHKLQQILVENIQEEIQIIENKIKAIENEKLVSIEEINAVFVMALLTELPDSNVFIINNKSLSDFITDTTFSVAWDSDSTISYRYYNNNRTEIANKLSDYNDIISPSYLQRKQYLEDNSNNVIIALNQKIIDLKIKSKHCQKNSVKELVKLVSRDQLYSSLLNNVDSKESSPNSNYALLIHLLGKGFIDEMYHVYISHFLEGHVTKGDMSFVLKVKSNQPCDSKTSLIEKNEIVKYLNSDDYNNEAVFNYDLINHLITERETEHLKMIVKMVKNDSSKINVKDLYESLPFIYNKNNWLREVISVWQSIWFDIIVTDSLNTLEKNIFLVTLLGNLYDSFENTLLPINEEHKIMLKNHINEISHLSVLMPENKGDYTNVINALNFLEIQLKGFDADEINSQFISDIINNNLFLPSIDSYKHLAAIITNRSIDDIEMTLSTFRNLDDDSLSIQIDNDINDFVSKILLNDGFIIGEESSCLYLFNNHNLNYDLKEELISKEDIVITNLESVDEKQLWLHLLKSKKLKISWENIALLIEENELYTSTIDYLRDKEVYSVLASEKQSKHTHIIESSAAELLNMIGNSINGIDAFRAYCPLFKESILTVPLASLATEQVEVLIDYDYVEFTVDNYDDIENYHSSLRIKYIERRFSDVIKSDIYLNFTFTADEMLRLLKSVMLEPTFKLSVSVKLDLDTKTISNNLFEAYYEVYSDVQSDTPEHILRLLLSCPACVVAKKISLLTPNIAYISKNLTFEFLGSLGGNYLKLANTQTHCRVDNSKENKALAEMLVGQGYFSISEFNEYSDTIRLNKKGK